MLGTFTPFPNMPSEDEIKFARLRFKIRDAICTCFSTAKLLLPLDLRAASAQVDSVVGEIQCDTLSGQQLVLSRTYSSHNGTQPEKIDVAIGHTGQNWTAIVTVTSTSSEPEQVTFEGKFEDALHRLLVLITERIKSII